MTLLFQAEARIPELRWTMDEHETWSARHPRHGRPRRGGGPSPDR